MPPPFQPSWRASSAICISSAATASRCSRSPGSTSRYGISPRRAQGVPLHRPARRPQARRAFPPMRACCASALRRSGRGRMRCRAAARLHRRSSCTRPPCRPCSRRGRRSARSIPLMVDMNCPMDGAAAISFAHACRAGRRRCSSRSRSGRRKTLRRSRRCGEQGGLTIAAGENACTVYQFRQMMTAGAVSHAQPSVIKVGGITEYLEGRRARRRKSASGSRRIRPISVPGLLATLQLHVAARRRHLRRGVLHEARRLSVGRPHRRRCADGAIAVPEGPGLGYEPDMEVLERYRVA